MVELTAAPPILMTEVRLPPLINDVPPLIWAVTVPPLTNVVPLTTEVTVPLTGTEEMILTGKPTDADTSALLNRTFPKRPLVEERADPPWLMLAVTLPELITVVPLTTDVMVPPLIKAVPLTTAVTVPPLTKAVPLIAVVPPVSGKPTKISSSMVDTVPVPPSGIPDVTWTDVMFAI